MKKINKWINEYILNVDLNTIEWVKLNSKELEIFINNNYLDKDVWSYVCNLDANSLFPTILGMNYLNLNNLNNKTSSFLLGIVNNNIGKKTIVCATIYLDKYYMFSDQIKPITYISTTEVNSYFRNKGLYKKMCEVLINYINLDQHIVTTMESEMGEKYHVFDILKKCLIKNGFENYIFEDNYCLSNDELHDIICLEQKILKKM